MVSAAREAHAVQGRVRTMDARFGSGPSLEKSAHYRSKGWWRDETVLDDLRRAIQRHPDKTAIVAARYFSKDVVRLSYSELGRYAERFAGALLSLGVARGELVAVQLPNWWQFTALALACARIGAIIAPIPPDYRRREVEFILGRTESSVYVGPLSWSGHSHRDMLREARASLPALQHRVFIGAGAQASEAGELDFDAYFVERRWEEQVSSVEFDSRTARADDICNVLYTSGTTGEPKGVIHSHNTNHGITRALVETMALGADDVVCLPSLLTASSGFTYLYLMPVLLGATAVYMDVGDPELTLRCIEEHGVTFMYGIPTYVMNVIAAKKKRGGTRRRCGGCPRGPSPCLRTSSRRCARAWGFRCTRCGG